MRAVRYALIAVFAATVRRPIHHHDRHFTAAAATTTAPPPPPTAATVTATTTAATNNVSPLTNTAPPSRDGKLFYKKFEMDGVVFRRGDFVNVLTEV